MKNNMGIESIKLTREASKAVRPHCAILLVRAPCAAAVTAAMIFFWFGQMIAWTFAIMMMPSRPPIRALGARSPLHVHLNVEDNTGQHGDRGSMAEPVESRGHQLGYHDIFLWDHLGS